MIPSKGVTWLRSVSPAEVASVVDSGLSVGTKFSLHSGSFIDEGASREELSSTTSVCLGVPLPDIHLFVVVQIVITVGPVDVYPSVVLVRAPENVRIQGLPGTVQ